MKPLPEPNTAQPPELLADDLSVDAPQAFSLFDFSFNFTLDTDARVRGLMGAPAFALRRKRLDKALDRFWRDVEESYRSLWVAAADGRIDEDGRELRQSLLDNKGYDRFAHLDQRKKLFRLKVDEGEDQVRVFNKAWAQYLERLDLSALEAQVDDYNRYFPIEANLATDPETGHFLWKGRKWEGLVAPDRSGILERFPLK